MVFQPVMQRLYNGSSIGGFEWELRQGLFPFDDFAVRAHWPRGNL